MSERAIEAAVKAAYAACDASYVGELRPDQTVTIDGLTDLKAMITAAIRAYLAALAEDDAAVEQIGKAANVAWHKWLADSMNTTTSLDAIGSPAQACGRAAIRALGE